MYNDTCGWLSEKNTRFAYQSFRKIKTRSRWRLKRLRAEPPPANEPRISQGHVIKVSCDITGRSPSRKAIILPSLITIDTLVIEI